MKLHFPQVIPLFAASLLVSFAMFGTTPAQAAGSATLRFSPLSGQYSVGDTFSVNVLLDSPSVSAAAAQSTIDYSSNLKFTAVSIAGSVLPDAVTTPDPNTSTSNLFFALTDFTGTGYKGTGGKLVALTFKVLSPGPATVAFNMTTPPNRDTEVVDTASPTNQILGSTQNGSYTVAAIQVTPTPTATPVVMVGGPAKTAIPSILPITGQAPTLPLLIVGSSIFITVYLFKQRRLQAPR